MSIDLTLIHVKEISKCMVPYNILDLQQTNLVEYFIEKKEGTPIGKKDRLFYSEDPELPRYTTETPYGVRLHYITPDELKDIPKELLKGKNERNARAAIEYLKNKDGYIILWFH